MKDTPKRRDIMESEEVRAHLGAEKLTNEARRYDIDNLKQNGVVKVHQETVHYHEHTSMR